ncbi:MAG: T9SS type A sorting domain-containing protein [Bacteroidia bacterium]|nr:T9SS type A sorting domain-containing protein [Bacteroidia bacterium]
MKKLISTLVLLSHFILMQAQPVLVKDIVPGITGSSPSEFCEMGGKVYFAAINPDSTYANCLYVTDGTTTGTKKVSSLASNNYAPNNMVTLGNKIIFAYHDGVHGWEPWISDGSPGGTLMLKDILTGSTSSLFMPLGVIGQYAYFISSSTSGLSATSLWKTDGTSTGTAQVSNANFNRAITFKNKIYCWGKTLTTSENGLYVIDGVNSLPQLIKAHKTNSYYDFAVAQGNNKFYYVASDSVHGFEPWVSDGTTGGTSMIRDFNPGIPSSVDEGGSSNYTVMTTIGDILYFNPVSPAYGRELWKTDGLDANTILIKDIEAGTGSSNPKNIIAVGNKVFFSARVPGFTDGMLYCSDGTVGNAQLLDINGKYLKTGDITNFKNTAIISGTVAGQEDKGIEMYTSNGTSAGTKLVADIDSVPYSEGFSSTKRFKYATATTLYFVGNDGLHGSELWKYEGGVATILPQVKDYTNDITIYPNPATTELNLTCSTPIKIVEIYNLAGLLQTVGSENKIDISSMAPGIYFIKISTAGAGSTLKFIKQ